MEEKLITHYTSDIGFNSIVSSGKLWFTDVYYLNDYNERQLFVKGLLDKYGFSEYLLGLSAELRDLLLQVFNGFIDKSLKAQRCFVFSCSSLNDDLALWNYYSKNPLHGGYNISFEPDVLCKSIALNEVFGAQSIKLFFGEVYYSEILLNKILDYCHDMVDRQFNSTLNLYSDLKEFFGYQRNLSSANNTILTTDIVEKSIQEVFCDLKPFLQQFFSLTLSFVGDESLPEPPYVVHRYHDSTIIEDAFSLDCFYKNSSFYFEKESRLVIQIDNSHIPELVKKGIYKTRVAHGMVIPYLEIPFDKSSIKEVCIAPTNSVKNNKENIEMFLCEHEVDAIVRNSNISVRF